MKSYFQGGGAVEKIKVFNGGKKYLDDEMLGSGLRFKVEIRVRLNIRVRIKIRDRIKVFSGLGFRIEMFVRKT